MKYLCLIYEDQSAWQKMSDADRNKGMAEYGSFTESIKKSGHYVGGEALQPTNTATTVRVRNGKVSVADGPFTETKECLAGFYLIDATDLNGAIQIASQMPPARVGSIEVRPVRELMSTSGERRKLIGET